MAEKDIIARLKIEGLQSFVQGTEQAAKAEDKLNQEIVENTTVTNANATAQKSLKAQLREMQAELAKLALAGKANTAEYKKLRDEAGNLKDAIGDVAAEIAQAGSDTKGLDKALRAATVVTGAFTAFQGVAALAGKENEKLQEALLKVTAAMSILQGLQAIQNELLLKDSLFTSAAAKAKGLYAAAVGTATGSTKAFRLALIATGLGAFVVLIGSLIANWDRLSEAIGLSNKRLREQDEALQDVINSNAELEASQDRQLKLLKLNGATESQLNKENLAFTRENLEVKKIELEILRDKIKLEKQEKTFLEFGKSLLPFRDKVLDQKRKEADIDAKYASQLIDLQNKIVDLQVQEQDLLTVKEKSNKETTKAREEVILQIGSLAALRAEVQRVQKQLENTPAFSPEALVLTGKLIDAEKQLKEAEDEFARLRFLLTKKFEELGVELTPISIDAILPTEKSAADQAKLIVDAFNDALAKNPPKKIVSPEEQREANLQTANEAIANSQFVATKIFDIARQSQEAQKSLLDNRLKQGLISEKEYERELAKIRTKEAKAAKTQALFDAGINLASAITAALAKGANIPLSILVAAIAGAQLAAIAATPIPKFFKGVKNFVGGLAWVGDGGKREPITDKNNQLIGISPDKPTLVELPKGANVYKDIPTFNKSFDARQLPMRVAPQPLFPSDNVTKQLLKRLDYQSEQMTTLLGLHKVGNKNTKEAAKAVISINKTIKAKRYV